MHRRTAVAVAGLAALACALALGAAAPAASGAPAASDPQRERRCGAIPRTPVFDVRAYGIACAPARRLAAAHARSAARGGRCDPAREPGYCALDAYGCFARDHGPPLGVRITCTLRRRDADGRSATFRYRGESRPNAGSEGR